MDHIRTGLDWFFYAYGLTLFGLYFSFVVLALIAIKKNKKQASFLDVNNIKGAQNLPSVSLIAPAYNEGKTIVTNLHSLLSLQYPFYELIVVNDGSKDDSLNILIEAFELVEIENTVPTSKMTHAEIIGQYQSTNKKFGHLTVINKKNGGRADAINCGIAIAKTNLVLCTDADCIIEQNALLKMVRPYLEELDREVIACGGGIGIANDSIIRNGTLDELRLPKSWLARIQVVEYIRAFLLGRMAWHQMDGLMLVSGAFGLYPRNRVVEVGGFDKDTVGEDLELCMRLRVHMENQGLPYDVVYIPETLCWTEAPADAKIYITQRDRWARGLWETIKKHRYLFLNKKYGAMGFFFFPYWVFFELMAPVVEILGIILITVYAILGFINWPFAGLLYIAIYLLGCVFSTLAILIYTINFKQYAKPGMVIRLILSSFIEPFSSHLIMLYAEIKGYLKKVFKVKSTWGTMTRKGFTTTK